jgi:hypothetical protein
VRSPEKRQGHLLVMDRKSQVALQYAYAFKERKPNSSIFWVFAGNKERFEQDSVEIAKGLRLLEYNDPEVDVLYLVKKSLQESNSKDWLMIIDNADDMSLFDDRPKAESDSSSPKLDHQGGLLKYIPINTAGLILYTTKIKINALRLIGE